MTNLHFIFIYPPIHFNHQHRSKRGVLSENIIYSICPHTSYISYVSIIRVLNISSALYQILDRLHRSDIVCISDIIHRQMPVWQTAAISFGASVHCLMSSLTTGYGPVTRILSVPSCVTPTSSDLIVPAVIQGCVSNSR